MVDASRASLGTMASLRSLRLVAAAEATSFLALLVASYVKHQGDGALGVSVLGPIHGALFLAYVFLALQARAERSWPNRTTALVLVCAVLPFGGYAADAWLLREPQNA